MGKIRFVHAADLHLDTPFRGLSLWNKELASKLKDATFKSFARIIDVCLSEEVDFLIVSGDIFDGESKSLAAQIQFVNELKRLSDKGIEAYLACGNHDPLESWLESLQMPEHVYRFGGSAVEVISHIKNGKPVVDIYGISYPRKEVSENLAAGFIKKSDPAPLSVAVLHGTVGAPGPHQNYAPFSLDQVAGKGFDYWALGHIHKHQVIRKQFPAVVYPGNPQGRDFGETGPKGCCLVEAAPDEPPSIVFIPCQVIQFGEIQVDLTGESNVGAMASKLDEAISKLRMGDQKSSHIIRLQYTGRTNLHRQLATPGEATGLKDHFNESQTDRSSFVWIDSIDIQTRPDIDLEQIRNRNDFIAEVLKTIEDAGEDSNKLSDMIKASEDTFGSMEVIKELPGIGQSKKLEIMQMAKYMLLDNLTRDEQ